MMFKQILVSMFVAAQMVSIAPQALGAERAVLRIPVLIEANSVDGDDDPVAASVINKKLAAIKQAPIPEFVEFKYSEASSYYDQQNAFDSQVQKSLLKLNPKYKYVGIQTDLIPGESDSSKNKTCFIGDGTAVSDIVGNLAGIQYSEQLNIWGWKFASKSAINQDADVDGTLESYLNENSSTWKNWDKKRDAVLILTAYSDDGDDVNESLIERCK